MRKTAVFGIYATIGQAERAVDTLVLEGFSNSDVSVKTHQPIMAWAKLLGYEDALSLLKANEQEEKPHRYWVLKFASLRS